MKSFAASTAMAVLLAGATALGQAPRPTTVPRAKPSLKRDRTSRVMFPRIIQHEDERVVAPALVDMLQLSNGAIRKRAMLALGRIGYPSGAAVLIEAVKNERSGDLRAMAAFALGETETHYAVPALLDRLSRAIEPEALVRARAAEALGKIASNPLSARSLGDYGVKAIAATLADLLPSTGEAISDDDRLIGSLTLTALLRIKSPETIGAITSQLGSRDPTLRWQAANALARIRDGISSSVEALMPLLADQEPLVRMHAARALGVAGDRRAVDLLMNRLRDSDSRVVVNAVNALGALGDSRSTTALIGLGEHRLTAFRSFDRGRNGVPEQLNLLLPIATALGNIKDDAALPFLKTLRFAEGKIGLAPETETAVARFGEDAFFDVPEIIKLERNDWRAVSAYAQGLGDCGTKRASVELLSLLNGEGSSRPDPRAVPEILNSLLKAKAEGLSEILLEQLKAEDVVIRATAATLLGNMGDPSGTVMPALQSAYRAAGSDKMNDARIAILEAADKLGRPMSIQVLADPTRDPDYVVRLKAAELLRRAPEDTGGARLQIGGVETGHDRAYWRRMAQLMTQPRNPEAVIHTKKGKVVIELFAGDAPMTVNNFMQLAESGFYNGLTFMRVVPNFVIQGGDPRNDMNGGPGHQIRCEINQRPYETGAVGMALSGKDTGGSQFFITHSPQPHLDGGYTVFGQVREGMDAVNRIARGDVIERIEIVEQKP